MTGVRLWLIRRAARRLAAHLAGLADADAAMAECAEIPGMGDVRLHWARARAEIVEDIESYRARQRKRTARWGLVREWDAATDEAGQ